MKILAPICLFTFNRLNETKQTVNSLRMNYLASQSELFIFSDGPKCAESKHEVNEVRKYLSTISGFKKVRIYKSEFNKGLADSVIFGVDSVISKYGKVIVLEDDLITTPNFLDFMNKALVFYERDLSIFSISGYSMNLPSLLKSKMDYYVGVRASSWGWGTWNRSWMDIDWEINDFNKFIKSKNDRVEFNKGGSDMTRMLKKQMNSKIDSWAIRWCYNQFRRNQLTIFSSTSKVQCIGFGENATHTKSTNRFDTILDTSCKRDFLFQSPPIVSSNLLKEFRSKFSLFVRLIDKLKNGNYLLFFIFINFNIHF